MEKDDLKDKDKDRGRIEVGPLCPRLEPIFFPLDESLEYLRNLKKEDKDESSSQST